MKKIPTSFCLWLSLFVGFIFSNEMIAQEFQKKIFLNDNDTLNYNLLIPDKPFPQSLINIGSDIQQLYPLIIFLHGAGERGNDNEIQIAHVKGIFLDSLNRKKFPAFVIAPQCPTGKRWVESSWKVSKHIMPEKPSISIALTMQLIDSMINNFPIDKKRIYITGLSMGGFGTWDLICRYPNKFAAAIPICGGGDITMAKKIKNKPIWAFHGSEDKVVKVILTREMINSIKQEGGTPKYTEYKGVGHDSWVKAYREKELLEWLFKQSL
jgi:predicted peptidase